VLSDKWHDGLGFDKHRPGGKTLGGYSGVWSRTDVYKLLLIGVSMTPRGEVALVIASIGFTQGYISHHVLVALMLMAIVSVLAGPVLMALLARLQQY